MPERALRIELVEEQNLRGRVLARGPSPDHAPMPVAGASVVVERAYGPLAWTVVATFTTYGVDGVYEVPGLAAGTYRVTAIAHGRAPSEEATVELTGGSEAPRVEGRLGGVGGAVPLAQGVLSLLERARPALPWEPPPDDG